MSLAPRRFASCTRVHKCRLETTGLLPQMRISRLFSNCSTSVPIAAPIVATHPALPAVAQIVRSSSDAPRRWKKRRSIEPYCRSPIVPAYEYGTIACGPSGESAIAPNLRRDRVERFVPARCARSGLRPSCRRVASGAARARPNTCARGSARPSCRACRRSGGWSGAPRTSIARPSSTVTSIAHVSGQSCGQAPRTTVRVGDGVEGHRLRVGIRTRHYPRVRVPPECARLHMAEPSFRYARRMSTALPNSAVSFPDGTSVPALGLGTWTMGEHKARAAAEAAALCARIRSRDDARRHGRDVRRRRRRGDRGASDGRPA